jgi:hypothetical protein
MNVTLPVSPISRKILISEYGAEPIRFPSRSPVFQILSYKPDQPDRNLIRLSELITSSVEIEVHSRLGHRLKKYGHQIGYHLYIFHLNSMMEFIWGSVLVGGEAKKALYRYYAINNISDDDYQIDSAYRRYQRWLDDKRREIKEKREKDSLYLSPTVTRKVRVFQPPIPLEEIQVFTAKFLFHNPTFLYTWKWEIRSTIITQLNYFLSYQLCGVTQKRIAQHYGKTRSAVSHSICNFTKQLTRKKVLYQRLKKAVKEEFDRDLVF